MDTLYIVYLYFWVRVTYIIQRITISKTNSTTCQRTQTVHNELERFTEESKLRMTLEDKT